jgi:hypothetical protein
MTATKATKEFAVELDTAILAKSQFIARLGQKIGQERRVRDALYSSEATKAKAQAKMDELGDEMDAAMDELRDLASQYTGWERYSLVTNPGGHVHSSEACSTCFPTTQFMWLVELSGTSNKELVELAGERACTVCFPYAPVDVTKRPSYLKYDVEAREAKAARDAEKATKAADRMAKALLPDGSELKVKVQYGEASNSYVSAYAKTLVSARNEALRNLAYSLETHKGVDANHDAHLKALREAYGKVGMAFVKAIAEKTGQDLEALTAEFMAKAEKKARA